MTVQGVDSYYSSVGTPTSSSTSSSAPNYAALLAAMSSIQSDTGSSDYDADPNSQYGMDVVSTSPYLLEQHKLKDKIFNFKKSEFEKAMTDAGLAKSSALASAATEAAAPKTGGRWTTSGRSDDGDTPFRLRHRRDPQLQASETATPIDPGSDSQGSSGDSKPADDDDDNHCHSCGGGGGGCSCGCSSAGSGSAGSCSGGGTAAAAAPAASH